MQAFEVYCRDGDGVYAIGIAVEITLVTRRGPISTSKHEYRPSTCPAVLYTIDNSLLDEICGGFHRPAVIRWPPTTTVDGHILKAVVQGSGLVDIRYWPR